MVTAKESNTGQLLYSWNSPESNHMACLHLEQNHSSANVALPVKPVSDLRGLNTGPQNPFGGFLKFGPPYENPYPKDSQCVTDKPINGSCAPQKRFLIFDQSGNHTRLFVSPSFTPENRIISPNDPASGNGLCEKVSTRVNEQFLAKSVNEEKWDENDLSDGEGENLEDSEEIDALLDSDSDDEYYDNDNDDDDDDEVTSYYVKDKSLKKLVENEEVASCDGSPKKKQKLLDGGFKKSSLVGNQSYEKKVKIFETLKKLESIIPGLKSKNPLSIIDEAIVYLESLKNEAEGKSVTFA